MKKTTKRRRPKRQSKRVKIRKKIKKIYRKNKEQCLIGGAVGITILLALFIVTFSGVKHLGHRGWKLLNDYEFPTSQIEAGNCMYPYDVGDGVVTFGAGVTFPTLDEGLDAVNKISRRTYDYDNTCIKVKDLKKLEKSTIKEFEKKVQDANKTYKLGLTRRQFNGVYLLAYNSPSILNDSGFVNVLMDSSSTYDDYVAAADNYYKQLAGYWTYGQGWYMRIIDSADVYFNGEYRYQNHA